MHLYGWIANVTARRCCRTSFVWGLPPFLAFSSICRNNTSKPNNSQTSKVCHTRPNCARLTWGGGRLDPIVQRANNLLRMRFSCRAANLASHQEQGVIWASAPRNSPSPWSKPSLVGTTCLFNYFDTKKNARQVRLNNSKKEKKQEGKKPKKEGKRSFKRTPSRR